jgi:hypothetical protein
VFGAAMSGFATRRRSYEICGERDVVWFLVFEDGDWYIEKVVSGAVCAKLSFDQFENSDDGRRLKTRLADALERAQMDL